MGDLDAAGADQPVPATDVPRLEGLLVRVPPRARQEQLEPDRPQAAARLDSSAKPTRERPTPVPRCGEAAASMPNSLASAATSCRRTAPAISPRLVATAISPAAMRPASSEAVVRVAPSRQSPRSAVA